MNGLEGFEDENPFEQEGDHIASETSSTSKVALYEAPSPPHPSRQLSPTSPNPSRPPFPSPGSHRQTQVNYKTDFCCTRDRVLHNGDDIEILVRCTSCSFPVNQILTCSCADNRRSENVFELQFAIHYLRHKDRSEPCRSTIFFPAFAYAKCIDHRTRRPVIATPNLKV